MLKIGDKAPDFTLPNQLNENTTLSSFLGQWVVLYFYPKAMTPGCTIQACSIRDNEQQLADLNIKVLAVSPDAPARLAKFTEKQNLNFTLLGDETHEVAEKYETWTEKSMFGKKYMGMLRTTYIINPAGEIAHVIPKVKIADHTETILSFIKGNK